MNITSMSNQMIGLSALQASSSTTATAQSEAVQKAGNKASARLDQELQTTTAQISAYGQVQSSFARVQDSGKALAATQSSTSTADLKKNLQAFVSAYNDSRSASAATSTGNASAASRELQRSVSTDSARADLKSLGITQNSDGSLTLNTESLDASLQSNTSAVTSAASRIGSTAEQSATSALAATGSIGSSVSTLNARETSIENRQAQQQQLLAESQQQVTQATNFLSSALAGIVSYNRIFSL